MRVFLFPYETSQNPKLVDYRQLIKEGVIVYRWLKSKYQYYKLTDEMDVLEIFERCKYTLNDLKNVDIRCYKRNNPKKQIVDWYLLSRESILPSLSEDVNYKRFNTRSYRTAFHLIASPIFSLAFLRNMPLQHQYMRICDDFSYASEIVLSDEIQIPQEVEQIPEELLKSVCSRGWFYVE